MGTLFAAIVWFTLYVIALLLPLTVALLCDPIEVVRPFLLELGVAFGFVAYPLMTSEFSLVGRIRSISVLYGNDVLVFFHKYMGLVALPLVGVHPLLVSPGNFTLFNPFSGAPMIRYGAWSFWLLLALALSSLFRKQIRLPYGCWMAIHYALALAIGALALAHILAVGGYSSHGFVRAVMIGCFAAFLIPMIRYRVWEYYRMLSTPWQVIENRDEGARVRTLVAKPAGHPGFEFHPGQFAWIATGHPITTEQHPISISSSAELGPDRRIELSIRNLGDWSGQRVPQVLVGSLVYVNGPFGAMSIDREPGQGFVLIAGGIGITPPRSMILTMKDRGDVRPVLLFYAATTIDGVLYRQELEALQRQMNLKVILVLSKATSDWTGERGHIDTALLKRYLPVQFKRFQYFVCGPGRMLDTMEEDLTALGLPRSRVHSERFDVV
jgi:predicted ferric reductase